MCVRYSELGLPDMASKSTSPYEMADLLVCNGCGAVEASTVIVLSLVG